jgi:hypothetical protein
MVGGGEWAGERGMASMRAALARMLMLTADGVVGDGCSGDDRNGQSLMSDI